MNTISLTHYEGHDVRVTFIPQRSGGVRVSSLAFAPDSSDIVAETSPTLYLFDTERETLFQEIMSLFPDSDPQRVSDQLETEGYSPEYEGEDDDRLPAYNDADYWTDEHNDDL